MTITVNLPPEAEKLLLDRASQQGEAAAEVASHVLAEALAWAEADLAEEIAGVNRGLADFEAGRYRPFGEFAAEQRRKYGLPTAE